MRVSSGDLRPRNGSVQRKCGWLDMSRTRALGFSSVKGRSNLKIMARRTRILIVEDVDEMRHLLADAIRGVDGFEVSGTAANTWEARIEVDRRRPDLVLLDEVLPGGSGVD